MVARKSVSVTEVLSSAEEQPHDDDVPSAEEQQDDDVPAAAVRSEGEPVIGQQKQQQQPPMVIVWKNVVACSLVHLAAIYAIFILPRARPLTWIWSVLVYVISGIGVTAGAHRLYSHRSFKVKQPLRFVLGFFNTTAFQNSIFDWARDHRVHHKYVDTDADPHNVNRGFFFAHVGWLLVKKHPEVLAKGRTIDFSDLYKDRLVMFQHKYFMPLALFCCFVIPTVVPWYVWGETLWNAYFVGILRYTLLLNSTWLINSAAHLWGNKPYDHRINPVQNLGVSFAISGEGFHNYHHVFPFDYSASEFGWYFNISTMFIDCMAMLGQVYDRRRASPSMIDMRKARFGDSTD